MGCFKCEATADKAILFDVISSKGIVKICNSCYKNENLPLVKQHDFSERKVDNFKSVHERLVDAAGIDQERQKTYEENKEILRKNLELKDLVNSNFKKTLNEISPREDLIENFHWVLMRARRKKHLTQKKIAEEIAEPELAIKMAEQGVLGENGDTLIKKLEMYLDINIIKRETPLIESSGPVIEELDEVSIDGLKTENFTIEELNSIQEKPKTPFWKSWMKKDEEEIADISQIDIDPTDEIILESGDENKQLNEKEIDDILFGRK